MSIELDQIIGCGTRNGKRYFLVRFKQSKDNEIIDWEAAKPYSAQVMEYFGSRLVWRAIDNILDSDHDDDQPVIETRNQNISEDANRASTSRLDDAPNNIEYEH